MPDTPQEIRVWGRPAELAKVAGLLALYYVLARWSLEVVGLRYAPVSLIWPPSGVALALVLRFGARPWPLLLAVAIAATWPRIAELDGSMASTLASAALIGASGTLEPLLAGWGIQRFARGAFMERASSFLLTILLLLPLSAAVAAVPLVAGSVVGGLTTVNHWAGVVTTWYGMAVADLIGIIILAPPIWLWMRSRQPLLTWRQALELIGLLGVAALALGIREPIQPLYLLFAAHLALAIRVPKVYAVSAVALTSVVLLWQAAAQISAASPPFVYQIFLMELTLLLTLNLITYVTAVLWSEVAERQETLEERVAERTRALERANDRLQHLSSTDPLTGAWNRRYFDEHTRRELERAAHGGSTAALLALDIDFFKRINDEHGHPTGDAVLEQVVSRLDQQLRPGDMLARIGGEEFVVFLPNCGRQTAGEVAERLSAAVAEAPIVVDGNEIELTVSIGVAVTRPADDRQGRPIEALLRATIAAADENLLTAKRAGRNQAVGP